MLCKMISWYQRGVQVKGMLAISILNASAVYNGLYLIMRRNTFYVKNITKTAIVNCPLHRSEAFNISFIAAYSQFTIRRNCNGNCQIEELTQELFNNRTKKVNQ